MRGKSEKPPPDEAIIIKIAKEYHTTPMDIEERMTEKWWNWIMAYESEYASAVKDNGRRKN